MKWRGRNRLFAPAAILLFFLYACGGGGGGGSSPEVTTLAATSVTTTTATLNGNVDPNGQTTEAWFEWGTSPTLVSWTESPHQTGLTGSTPVAVNHGISGLGIGVTYYFRVAAKVTGGTTVIKGSIENFSTSNPPPIADAGPDQSVYMGKTATLDGSGSSAPVGAISYQWEQLPGSTPVTLSSSTVANPTFTVPTVTQAGENLVFRLTVTDSITLLTASDNVTVTALWGAFDGFDTDTRSSYTQDNVYLSGPPPPPPFPEFNYDAVGKRVQVITADDVGLIFSKSVPMATSGVFQLDFLPTNTHPTGGGVWIRLKQDDNNYYELAGFDWDVPTDPHDDFARLTKVYGGAAVDNTMTQNSYASQDPPTPYHVSITFSPTSVSVTAFGQTTVLTGASEPINVSRIEIETTQQDAYYDNIELGSIP